MVDQSKHIHKEELIMQCRSCGTPLQSGTLACPTCGMPPSSDDSGFSSYEFNSEAVPYISQAQIIETSSVSSGQQSSPSSQPYTQSQEYSSPPFYTGVAPFSDSFSQQLPGAVQGEPVSQPQRGGLSAAMIALLIILTLLIVAGSGLAYYALAIRAAQHQTKVTAVTSTISTTQISTNAQNSTPITTTNPQDLYVQATSGAPALNDPLNSQNPNGWKALLGNCTFTGNVLHAIIAHSNLRTTTSGCVAASANFDNFAYQVKATIVQGDIDGLLFRLGTGLYLFGISSRGVYLLVSGQANVLAKGNFKLLTGANSSAINTGLNQPNLITVIARGSTIYLYVNKQYLTSVSDSTSSGGAIGVFGEDTRGGPVDVAISEIRVWRL